MLCTPCCVHYVVYTMLCTLCCVHSITDTHSFQSVCLKHFYDSIIFNNNLRHFPLLSRVNVYFLGRFHFFINVGCEILNIIINVKRDVKSPYLCVWAWRSTRWKYLSKCIYLSSFYFHFIQITGWIKLDKQLNIIINNIIIINNNNT